MSIFAQNSSSKTIFTPHEARKAVLDELHARPFLPVSAPRRIYHFAFATNHEEAQEDRIALAKFSKKHNAPPAPDSAKFHYFDLKDWRLRWEQHTEFTTYTWSTDINATQPFSNQDPFASGEIVFLPPGRLIVATQISVVDRSLSLESLIQIFYPQSLCVIGVEKGGAEVLGDFAVDDAGYTRFILRALNAPPLEIGRLAQRILEIETYRTMALLALPVAREVSPELRMMEKNLSEITHALSSAHSSRTSQDLLKRLSDLLVSSEALAHRTAFRFGASRAYHTLVQNRLHMLREVKTNQYPTIANFLNARLDPAIETCNAIEKRQIRFSNDVERSTNLMRTGITLEMEHQNSRLLDDMNRRNRLQMRLNGMVQGISVAALAYYLTGLFSYVSKGLKDTDMLPRELTAEAASALTVPLALALAWAFMARIKLLSRRAAEEENIE